MLFYAKKIRLEITFFYIIIVTRVTIVYNGLVCKNQTRNSQSCNDARNFNEDNIFSHAIFAHASV